MPTIFRAKTGESYIIKILAELLHNNFERASFTIDKNGIKLCMTNERKDILIDLYLDSKNFSLYKFKKKEKMKVGINLNHFHQMLKTIKKQDFIELFIKKEKPNNLGIKVVPKDSTRVTTSYIVIQDIQDVVIDVPRGYSKPIIVASSEFQKMCKGMSKLGDKIRILAKGFKISFTCDDKTVIERTVDFGESDDDSSDDEDEKYEDEKEEKTEYQEEFRLDRLICIAKIAGLGQNMQIFPKTKLPLFFASNVGTLGKINIYVKSEELLIEESTRTDSDDDISDDDE